MPSIWKAFWSARRPFAEKPSAPAPPPSVPVVTPGTSRASCAKFRPLSGSARIFCVSTTAPSVALWLSIRGASAVIATVSVIWPTSSATLMRAFWSTCKVMSSSSARRKPWNSTLTL